MNFLILGLSQIEAHNITKKTNANEIIYKTSLYVKQDVYRLMILAFIYFALFSALQINSYGYGMLATFLCLSVFFLKGIIEFDHGNNSMSLILLSICAGILICFICLRVTYPQLFIELGISREGKCLIYENMLN